MQLWPSSRYRVAIPEGDTEGREQRVRADVRNVLERLVEQQSAPAAEQDVLTDRDWPEDFAHENGKYFCTCMFCDKHFVGHKRRVACKKCSAPSPAQEKRVEASAQANAIIDACPFPLSDEAEYYLRERIAVHLARALATASPSEDTKPHLAVLADYVQTIGYDETREDVQAAIDAAMSSPSVTQAAETSAAPPTLSAQERQSQETDGVH
jgi:hypothetical protein